MRTNHGVKRSAHARAVGVAGIVAAILPVLAVPAGAAVYEVGEAAPYTTIGSVPWESLSAGDTVLIHWRAQPYREKWVIGGTGTASEPIVVRGVPGPQGQLPVIDGENATTRQQLDYWSESRSVIKVGGSSIPSGSMPRYIAIENLDVRGARPPNTFQDDSGGTQTYASNAAAIHVEIGENITIRGCIIRDCGNGLFVSSSDAQVSRDILIEGNYIHGNGNIGSILHHNTYTAAIGIIYQYNRFGPLLDGAGGNNLKDRSAGLVVRYNWIEGGNRQLDLVDAEDSVQILNDPSYRQTFVYGNVFIELPGGGNKQIGHYGGDSGAVNDYRKGDLYFHHNTLVSTRTDGTTLWRLSTDDEHCIAQNNILYVIGNGDTLAILDQDGVIDLSHNWMKPGWRGSFGTLDGTINDDGTTVSGAAPGFRDAASGDYRLAAGSDCIDMATNLPPGALPEHDVVRQYRRHQQGQYRQTVGADDDIGAFEYRMPFDFNGDAVVDLADLPGFVACLAGPSAAPQPIPPADAFTCRDAFDTDSDGDVDLSDFSEVQDALEN